MSRTMCNPSAVAMHDGHCHLCQRLTMLHKTECHQKPERERESRLSSIPLRERLPTTTQHFRKKISTFKQLPRCKKTQLARLLFSV